LRPSTQKILSLAAEAKTLENDKEHLRINLARAEEEVRRVVKPICQMSPHPPLLSLSFACIGLYVLQIFI